MAQPDWVHCPLPFEWKDQAADDGALEGISTEVEAKFKGGTAPHTLYSQAAVKRKKCV